MFTKTLEPETFTLSNYEVNEKRQSKIDPAVTHMVTVGVHCPRCKTVGPTIKHGSERQCTKCRLNMQVHGNALECW